MTFIQPTAALIEASPDPELIMHTVRQLRKQMNPKLLGKDIYGYSEQLLEKLYAVALALFEKHHYEEAEQLFDELLFLDPFSYRFAFGRAAIAQKKRELYLALFYYTYAMDNDSHRPEPVYFAAECALQSGKEKAAAVLYRKAADLCSQDAHYKDLKERCLILAPALEKRVKEGLSPLILESGTKTSL